MGLERGLLRAADRVAGAFGILDRDVSLDALLKRAERRQGRRLGEASAELVMEPLQILLNAYCRDSKLSVVGRVAALAEATRFLSNLIRFDGEEQRQPDILRGSIRAPIFVTGMPRSGTSFLHRLLAEDPAHRVPQVWEAIYPYPDPGVRAGRDSQRSRIERRTRVFARLAPDFLSLHPLTATTPQECTELTAHTFRSFRFDTTHHVPSYREWLSHETHGPAYRFHKRFLQHLQAQDLEATASPRRWVLKAPEHVFTLETLWDVYPDALVIFVHRDPLKVLPSVARLTEVIREPFTRRLDRAEIGRQVTGDWLNGAGHMIRANRAPPRAGVRPIVHVHHAALIRRPLEVVADVYRQLGLEMSSAAEARIADHVARQPRGGYGQNRYRFADFGLDPARERERFLAYTDEFGVEPEMQLPTRPVLTGRTRPRADAERGAAQPASAR